MSVIEDGHPAKQAKDGRFSFNSCTRNKCIYLTWQDACMNVISILHECPTCGASVDEPCRTPKGRKKDNVHDTRPFSLDNVPTRKALDIHGECGRI